jgi:alkylation response protein AidB-like acyl-CoA dehydrogenase
MPHVLYAATGEILSASNMAFQMFNGLTHGAANALKVHGTEEQKATYLPKMYSGEWTGTMNLTEPHCGTDLGLIRTRAEPQEDGSYRISGTKIFISAGEHDLADNIIHLVLARIPGGPEGVKGISLFVVPKFMVNGDGSLGARNGLACGGLEEKMGIHGSPTCVMNYDGATGFLVGEAHKGLHAMFTMMNEARLSVGMQGMAQAELAYQVASAYARDRLQGRAVTGAENPDGPADPLIVHPDVRRMLMDIKSFVEGGRMLSIWAATLIDAGAGGDDEAEAAVSLLTPVIKGVLTDRAFDACVAAQQVFGGAGYIREWGIEQIVRDARIAMIYEGANGIQALDLVGRKLAQNGGKAMMSFLEALKGFCAEHKGHALAADLIAPLKEGSKDLQAAAMYFVQEGMKNPNAALAGSTDFMHLFGHVALAWMWARMALAAQEALEAGGGDEVFLKSKIATARYYMARQLPATKAHLARITSGADPVMALAPEAF